MGMMPKGGEVRELGSKLLDHFAYWLDCGCSLVKAALGSRHDPHALAIYFHAILDVPGDGMVDPQEGMTSSFLRDFIHSMMTAGYTFVTPDTMLGPNPPPGNLAVLTSDDGYRSVELLLPILEQTRVPLTVFLNTEYSRSSGMHWWDQLYIAGYSRSRTRSRLKHDVRTRAERDEALRRLALDPYTRASCDSHRLLSPDEVGRLARHPYIHFGNHTRNHLSLPAMEDSHVLDEIEGAGHDIEAWTSTPVHHFAFPYGHYDERVRAVLQRLGYRTAFTTESGPFSIPDGAGQTGVLVLPRYRLCASRSIKWQTRIMRHGITAGPRLQAHLRRWVRRPRPHR